MATFFSSHGHVFLSLNIGRTCSGAFVVFSSWCCLSKHVCCCILSLCRQKKLPGSWFNLQEVFITALPAMFITRPLHLTSLCMNFKCTTFQFFCLHFSIWTLTSLQLRLLNENERYYDHKGLWVIVKNLSVTHSPLPKKEIITIAQFKYFETLER